MNRYLIWGTLSAAVVIFAWQVLSNTALGWQRAQATCNSAWCHGSATPAWTSHGTASCGTCHEVPPATPAHAGASSIATCAGCHPRVIDTFGNFVFSGGASAHIDGDVDVF